MGQLSFFFRSGQEKNIFDWFYIRKSSQYIERFDPHPKIWLIMIFIWPKAAKSRKWPILPLTTLYSMLIKPESTELDFWFYFVEFEIKLLGEFSLKILLWSHCLVYLVIYIVVVTLFGTSWLIILLWSHFCQKKYLLKKTECQPQKNGRWPKNK
jgi:hypothetical protein